MTSPLKNIFAFLALLLSLLLSFQARAQKNEKQIKTDIDTALRTLKVRYIPVGQAGRGTGVLTEGGLHGKYKTLDITAIFSDKVVVSGDFPGSVKFPRSNLSVLIGGLAHGDFFFDYNPIINDEFTTAVIPVPTLKKFNTRLTGRRSRLWWRAAYPTISHGDISSYIEFDFFNGEEGNEPESAPAARARQAWVDFIGIKMGLYYSNFTDITIWPLIADEEGPGSFAWLRQGYIGKTINFSPFSLTFSVETPFSDLTFSEGYEPYNPSPDYIISFTYTKDWGHVRGAFLSRILGAQNQEEQVFAYGWAVTQTGKKLTVGQSFFAWSVTGGKGVGRYMEDGLEVGNLGGFQDPESTITPLPALGAWANYTHFWTEDLFTTALGGYVKYFPESGMSPDTFMSSSYGLLNFVWTPLKDFAVGIECIYGQRVNFDEQTGYSARLTIASQYIF